VGIRIFPILIVAGKDYTILNSIKNGAGITVSYNQVIGQKKDKQ
jgi:hypothetical protein